MELYIGNRATFDLSACRFHLIEVPAEDSAPLSYILIQQVPAKVVMITKNLAQEILGNDPVIVVLPDTGAYRPITNSLFIVKFCLAGLAICLGFIYFLFILSHLKKCFHLH